MNGATVEKGITISSKGIAWKDDQTTRFINLKGSAKQDQWIDVEDGNQTCNKNDLWSG